MPPSKGMPKADQRPDIDRPGSSRDQLERFPGQRPRPMSRHLGWMVAVALLLCAVAGLALLRDPVARPPQRVVTGTPFPAPLSAEFVAAKQQDREASAAAPLSDIFAAMTIRLEPVLSFTDGRTMDDGSVSVSLDAVEGPGRDAVCLDDDKVAWACGLRARAALNNLTRAQTVTCEGRADGGGTLRGSCRTEAGDLAALLVAAGFARPLDAQAMGAELALARSERRGLWNGGWTLRAGP